MADQETRIKQALEELRVIIPGTQVLLGFEFSAVLQSEFQRLPDHVKLLHILATCINIAALTCLLAPPMFHRLFRRGENSQAVEQFTSKMLEHGMPGIAVALCLELYCMSERVFGAPLWAVVIAALAAVLIGTLWYGTGVLYNQERTE